MFDEKQKEVEEQDEAGWFGSEGGVQGCSRRDSAVRARKRGGYEEGTHVYRVHERACTYVCARARKRARRSIGEREGGGWRGERERKGKIREFACAPVRDREESEKEKGTSGIEGEEEKEKESKRVKRRNLRLWRMCVIRTCVYTKTREAGEE